MNIPVIAGSPGGPPRPAATLPAGNPAGLPAGRLDFSKLDIASLKKERDRAVASADSKNPPISRVIPVPRVVILGGGPRVADELRIGDMARLQAWLEEQTPHPLAEIPPEWADPEPRTRPARLKAAWEASASWPIRYGTAEGSRLLGSTEGRAYFLTLCLRRSDPGFGLADALGLILRIAPLEWAALRRVAYGLTAREEVAEEIAPDAGPGKTANWCLSIHRATQFSGGPTYQDISEWTLSQWRNFCSEGKAAEFSAEFSARAKRVKAALSGPAWAQAGNG
jgi:hypothetical protein